MITPTGSQIIQSGSPKIKENPNSRATSAVTVQDLLPSESSRGSEGLAASIKSDGGLSFLQANLEEKMGSLFEEASANNPEVAATGPASAFDTSVDVSPEATADRIVSFALGLKKHYQEQNPQLDEKELMANFEAEIRRGIRAGFSSARGTLGGLDMLHEEIEANVDSTWELVQAKLDEAFQPPE